MRLSFHQIICIGTLWFSANFLAFAKADDTGALNLTEPVFGGPSSPLGLSFKPFSTEYSVRASTGYCPCLRWTFQFQGLGGEWVTPDFVLSTEALVDYENASSPSKLFPFLSSDTLRFGRMEVLASKTGLGLGFSGFTYSNSLDRGYEDLMRTGIYSIITILNTREVRLQLQSGYQLLSMRINGGDRETFNEFPQRMMIRWNEGRFDGEARGEYFVNPQQITNIGGQAFNASLNTAVRVVSVEEMLLKVGLLLQQEKRDHFQAAGLGSDLTTLGLFIKAEYDPQIQ